MEEIQQQDALAIDHTEQSQGYPMSGKQPGDGTSPLQEPATPWFRKGVLHSFVRSI